MHRRHCSLALSHHCHCTTSKRIITLENVQFPFLLQLQLDSTSTPKKSWSYFELRKINPILHIHKWAIGYLPWFFGECLWNNIDSRYIAVQCSTILQTVQHFRMWNFRPYFELTNDTHISTSQGSYGYLSWVIWRNVAARYRECTVWRVHQLGL